MKKVSAALLSVLMCGLLAVSEFAGQYKYEGKGFSFESDLAMENLGVDSSGEYIYEEDYGSDKAPDYYYYEIEHSGESFFEIEIEAYCGRFNFPLHCSVERTLFCKTFNYCIYTFEIFCI
ncbi:MAG: hypothetical protein J6D06_07775 [Clostridia bacterium]|nr:hypothetical protein [Clostridia bacterium]